MTDRATRERELRRENSRMKAALSAIHDALHADDANRAHELCETALCGGVVSQPNLSVGNAANGMSFAVRFNQLLAEHEGVRACCITLVPSATVQNAVSIQICGEVEACKIVEGMLRGRESTYMGDHAATGGGP